MTFVIFGNEVGVIVVRICPNEIGSFKIRITIVLFEYFECERSGVFLGFYIDGRWWGDKQRRDDRYHCC